MKFNCIKCDNIWGEWLEGEDREFYSSGLCKECAKEVLIPKIRNRQLKEGLWDCFGKAYHGYCDQLFCKYISSCIKLHV